ncbi:MAG TPA: aminopeptidase [Candidatus Scatomorpha merdigallinarum]|nr:aminopeptidase [Candidatus Scatomorpha merdigallinarum]
MEEKKDYRAELFYEPKNGYETMDAEQRSAMEAYCEDYKRFLNDSRTERECVRNAIALAEAQGFVEYVPGMELKTGDKIYYSNRGKALLLAIMGKKPMSEGAVVAAAHVDSPRLDLKQLPLYEDNELAFLKTHYYGGIKKYQWTAIPLELHGTVVTTAGETIDVVIGRDPDEPQFMVSDLLPHLAGDQMAKKLGDAIKAESMNILVGSVPYDDEGKDRVKLAVMSILNSRYGITEEDLISSELYAVPAFDVRDIGLDRSLIGGYGHDDRVCAYAELRALFDLQGAPERTAVCILADKEETGSDGVSGMKSEAFEWFMGKLCRATGSDLDDCFAHSVCISADVTAAFDPNYPDVSEKRNAAKLNYGVGLHKFTGARGKSGTNDAPAELVAYMRRVLNREGVQWQMCELGKVDQGGGGTVAMYMGNRNIDTIDAGVPVISMHAPFEVVAKYDCYMTYRAVLAVYADC